MGTTEQKNQRSPLYDNSAHMYNQPASLVPFLSFSLVWSWPPPSARLSRRLPGIAPPPQMYAPHCRLPLSVAGGRALSLTDHLLRVHLLVSRACRLFLLPLEVHATSLRYPSPYLHGLPKRYPRHSRNWHLCSAAGPIRCTSLPIKASHPLHHPRCTVARAPMTRPSSPCPHPQRAHTLGMSPSPRSRKRRRRDVCGKGIHQCVFCRVARVMLS